MLRATELEEKRTGTESRILVPDNVAKSSAQVDTMGIVVGIGEDAWKDASPRAKLGDRVLFTQYTGGTIKGLDGYFYRMINCDAIYAVMEENHDVA